MDAISRIVDLIGTVSDAGALLTALGPRLLAGMAVIVFVESGVLFPSCPATRCWSWQSSSTHRWGRVCGGS